MIYLASDHGGFDLKEKIKQHLDSRGLSYLDMGTYDGTTSVDYPDYAEKACKEIIKDLDNNKGILCCGSGLGVSMAANKFSDIRAALVYNEQCAILARQHNNANVICFGGRIIDHKDAIRFTDIFLETEFEGGRHCTRINKMTQINHKGDK